jgi:hypothetical protein
MSTLLNKYYTGTYDPNLASEIETARPVVKLDTPVYHQTQATKVIWEYPWPYTQMIMAQDGKVKPEQFQGRERPSDEFVKSIVRQTEQQRHKEEREDRQKPLVDSRNIDRLLKQQAMMKFANDNRNRNVMYEASLLSAAPGSANDPTRPTLSEKEKFMEENAYRDKYYGVQALTNPATKRYMEQQQEYAKYFQDLNLRLDALAGGGAPATPGGEPAAATCPPTGSELSSTSPGGVLRGTPLGAPLGAPLGEISTPGDHLYEPALELSERSERPTRASSLSPETGDTLDKDDVAGPSTTGEFEDEHDAAIAGRSASGAVSKVTGRTGLSTLLALSARKAAELKEGAKKEIGGVRTDLRNLFGMGAPSADARTSTPERSRPDGFRSEMEGIFLGDLHRRTISGHRLYAPPPGFTTPGRAI